MSITLLNFEKGVWVRSIDSTNTHLKKNEFEPGVWIFADEQTAGRGRKDKIWNSIGEDKIIFSGKIEFKEMKFQVSIFSLLVGCAILKSIMKVLPEQESELTIKWPNDIYRNNKKIAGILIECEQQGSSLIAIVGIGLNIYGQEIPEESDKIGFLLDAMPERDFRRKLIENLIYSVNHASLEVLDPGSIRKELAFAHSKSFLQGKIIKAQAGQRQILGKPAGFTMDGFLIVETENGERVELMDTGPGFEVIG